ncbi:hypothetical protein [uncultured Aquabacterium sp.]|nr:hypothetical protein [uncultured Aquabacterium sp.]
MLTDLQALADLLAVGDMDAADALERLAHGKALTTARDVLSSLNASQA